MGNSDLDRLKAGYETWHSTKGESDSAWLELMDDKFRLTSMGEEAPGISFAKARTSKQEAIDYLQSVAREWRMIHWTPENFICEGDRIAVFGRCAWVNRATEKTADCRIAHLWRFKNGKAVELTEVFDSARAAAAAMP